MKGKLIIIEGATDGIGKSTQYKLLCEKLKKKGYQVYNHHFPSYETSQALVVTEYLEGKYGQPSELSPYFINSLYAIDRGVTWYMELSEKYNQGNIVLLDRYTTSSLIYQSSFIEDDMEKRKFIDYVADFEYNKIGMGKPDQVIFLCAPFNVVTKLRRGRVDNEGVINDVYERDIDLMKKVYNSSLFVAKYLKWDIIKCNNGKKMRSIEEIHEDICEVVYKHLLSEKRGVK